MKRIGSFGTIVKAATEPEVTEFEDFLWFETPIRLRDWVSPLPMTKFAEIIERDQMRMNVPAVASIRGVLEASVHPDDWDLFEARGLENDADLTLLEELAENLFVWWSQRPIHRQSGSSTGLSTNETEAESNEPSSNESPDSQPQDSSTPSTPEPELATTS